MKIRVKTPENLYEGTIEIEINTEDFNTKITFGSGEPEDMCLARDLNDAFSIEDMLIAAYEAGKRGETIEVNHEKEEED